MGGALTGAILVSGACDLGTAGACVVVTPATITIGGGIGGAIGGALGWVGGSIVDFATKLGPVSDADGDHTTWKVDPNTGEITRTETWAPNPQNPSGWDSEQATDVTGSGHFDKGLGEVVPTPHTRAVQF